MSYRNVPIRREMPGLGSRAQQVAAELRAVDEALASRKKVQRARNIIAAGGYGEKPFDIAVRHMHDREWPETA